MKKFLLSLALAALAGTSTYADSLYTLTFSEETMQSSISSYTNDWENVCDGNKWIISNFNNNKKGWDFIRAGRKNNKSTASIKTDFYAEGAVGQIIIYGSLTIANDGSNNNITDAYVTLSSESQPEGTKLQINPDLFKGSKGHEFEVTVDIPNPESSLSYEITFEIASMSANGMLQISKVEYIEGGEAPSVATPSLEMVKGDNGYEVSMSCETDGASIYYAMGDEEPQTPDNNSTLYTAPVPVTATTYFKAIAYVGNEASYVASFTANPPYVCENFEGITQLNSGKEIELTGNIYGVYQNGNNLYVADALGNGMLLYGSSDYEVKNGDVIDGMEGTYSPYNGLPEITNYTLGTITEGTAIEPSAVELSDINKDMLNKYIKLSDIKITGISGRNATAENASGETMAIYNSLGIDLEEGENFNVVGFVSIYATNNNETIQIVPAEITGGVVMETVATPTFNPASGELEANTEITITCETEGATIYYTTDKSIPTIESTEYAEPITFTEAMTIKAIAVKEGMLDSEVAEVVYTLYDPDAPQPTTFTFDFSDPDFLALNDLSVPSSGGTYLCEKGGSKDYIISGTNDPVIMTIAVADNASNVSKLWNSGEVRLYGGTTVTFKINNVTRDENPESVAIQKIEFDESAKFEASFSPDTYDASTKIWNGEEDAEAASEFVITPSKRSDFTKAVVSLKTITGIGTIASESDAPEVYYNLQGVRVAQPQSGLYIVVKGNSSRKVLVK